MDIAELKAEKQRLESEVSEASDRLNQYRKGKTGQYGLILEQHDTIEYRVLRRDYAKAFHKLREFNGKHIKAIRKAA